MKNSHRSQINFFLFFFISLTLIFLPSCKKEKTVEEKISPNSLSFVYNTGFFHPPAKLPKYFFQKGWLIGPDNSFLLIHKKGMIRFQVLKKEDLNLKFLIRKGKRLKKNSYITLLLNNKKIKKIKVPDKFHQLIIPVTKDLEVEGNNYFVVNVLNDKEFQGKESSEDFTPACYLVIKNIAIFKKNNIVPKDAIVSTRSQKIRQYKNSKVYFYFSGGENIRELYLHFYSAGDYSSLNIYYESSSHVKKILKENVKIKRGKNEIRLKLPKLRKGIYRIIVEGSIKAPLIWNNIKIVRKIKREKADDIKHFFKGKPDVYYIVLDALRFDTIKKRVDKKTLTPAINRFAENAFNFQNFYANAPYTRASVSTLFTGLLPETHGVREKNSQFPDNLLSIQKVFKDNGYYTATLYGTHVLSANNLIEGFDEKVNVREFEEIKSTDNTSWMNKRILKNSLRRLSGKKPKFVYIHLLPPHEPYNPPMMFRKIFIDTSDYYQKEIVNLIENINLYENISPRFRKYLYRAYLNNVYYSDFLVQYILRTLKVLGEYDSSIIIITADHGEAFFEHHKVGHNKTNYEEMSHIPFIVKLPYQKKAKKIYVKKSLVDFFPTIIELLNLKVSKNIMIQGKSFAKCFYNQKCNDDLFIYSRTDSENLNNSIIWKNYKYINDFGYDELYNLKKDPHERNNIANEHPFLTGFLRQKCLNQVYKNISLRKKLKVSIVKKKFSKEDIEKLKSLGYL